MNNISIEEAIRILDPETSSDAIAEIEYYSGFRKDKTIEKVNDACEVACNTMRAFLKLKTLYTKVCERCDELEKENIELTDLDELIKDL